MPPAKPQGTASAVGNTSPRCRVCGLVLDVVNRYRSVRGNICVHCYKEKQKQWYERNKERKRQTGSAYSRKVKGEVLSNYGGQCACCGETRLEFLTIDHIDGGGNAERRRLRVSGGVAFYLWLRKSGYPDGYRVLCWNCNAAIGFFGECPHARSS
jgi:hypothetical protein